MRRVTIATVIGVSTWLYVGTIPADQESVVAPAAAEEELSFVEGAIDHGVAETDSAADEVPGEDVAEEAGDDEWIPRLTVNLNDHLPITPIPDGAAEQTVRVARPKTIYEAVRKGGQTIRQPRTVMVYEDVRVADLEVAKRIRIDCDNVTSTTKTTDAEDPIYTLECSGRVRIRFLGTEIQARALKFDGQTITFSDARITTSGATIHSSDGKLELSVKRLAIQKYEPQPTEALIPASPYLPSSGATPIPEAASPAYEPIPGFVPTR